jgi:hypothetical protein
MFKWPLDSLLPHAGNTINDAVAYPGSWTDPSHFADPKSRSKFLYERRLNRETESIAFKNQWKTNLPKQNFR